MFASILAMDGGWNAEEARRALRRFMDARATNKLRWATSAGVSEGTLRNFLNGDSQSLTHKTLAKLARAERVSIAQMLGQEPLPDKAEGRSIDAQEVPLIDYVQAGKWTEIGDLDLGGESLAKLYTSLPVSAGAFGLYVLGRSMEAEFHDGDVVIIDPAVTPHPGDYVVAKRKEDEEATFKRYRPRGKDVKRGEQIIELAPLNQDFPTLRIEPGSPGKIVGVVVEHRRYLRARQL